MFKGFIGTFKAAYGREGLIWIDESKCDLCDEETTCLHIDSSEGEYGSGKVCELCTKKIFWRPGEEILEEHKKKISELEKWDTNRWCPQSSGD